MNSEPTVDKFLAKNGALLDKEMYDMRQLIEIGGLDVGVHASRSTRSSWSKAKLEDALTAALLRLVKLEDVQTEGAR